MDKIILKPRDGVIVINPINGKPLAPEGEAVEPSEYFDRRLLDGDVTEVIETPKKKTK